MTWKIIKDSSECNYHESVPVNIIDDFHRIVVSYCHSICTLRKSYFIPYGCKKDTCPLRIEKLKEINTNIVQQIVFPIQFDYYRKKKVI